MAEPLLIEPRGGFGLATVMARTSVDRAAIGRALGVTAPDRPRVVAAGDGLSLIGAGPGTWLALQEDADRDFAESLRDRLQGLASVSDQSSSYVMLRLSGDGARQLLQRGAAIDLHPSVFTTGTAAVTMIAHIGVIFWQVDDRPAYDIATFRSYADSFRHWLDDTAASLSG